MSDQERLFDKWWDSNPDNWPAKWAAWKAWEAQGERISQINTALKSAIDLIEEYDGLYGDAYKYGRIKTYTVIFGNKMRNVPKCGIDRDSKDDDCGHLNKVSLPSKDTKKEGGE